MIGPLGQLADAVAGESEFARENPKLREQMLAKWTRGFWTPLYQSCCQTSLEQYNQMAVALQPKIESVIEAYGSDFAPIWYYSGSGQGERTATIDEHEYNRRRNELGCPLVAPKPRWGLLVAGGVVLVAGTVALMQLIQGKPKRRKRKR